MGSIPKTAAWRGRTEPIRMNLPITRLQGTPLYTIGMRVFGRHVSKWWLVATAPLFLLACPALLMLFFMGNNLAIGLFGPPAIWNQPWGFAAAF